MHSGKETAPELGRYRLHIGGEWVDSLSGRTFCSENPATGRIAAQVAEAISHFFTPAEVTS